MNARGLRILEWLLDEGRLLPGPGPFFAGLNEHLCAAGLEIMRANVQVRTLHPEVGIMLYIWHRPDAEEVGPSHAFVLGYAQDPLTTSNVKESILAHGALDSEVYRVSPFRTAIEEERVVRARLAPEQSTFEYPILEDLRGIGATDYVALPMRFSSGPLSAVSFVTGRKGGYHDDEIELLTELLPAISICFELHSAHIVRRSLLRTYLGAGPGELVQAGHVQPGDVRRIDAAILFSDIRGFTTLSARTEATVLIETLNGYFGAVASALEENGGEVLKFIGDALLVVFPVRSDLDATAACEAALRASLAANERLDEWNTGRVARGEEPIDHGIGLHLGTAEYGNIGSTTRLDFTVIGRDVNLASRIEGMCGQLGRRLLVSREFANQLDRRSWVALGEYPLKGIDGPQALFGVEST